jgi:hypothetical protein
MSKFTRVLAGGDKRSIGQSDAAVKQVVRDPTRLTDIIDGLDHGDPVVRMRCADVAEKVSARQPDWLQPHKRRLMKQARASIDKELCWHLAQMLPRLTLTDNERRQAEETMLGYLKNDSRIVQTFALEALADLSASDATMAARVRRLTARLARTGSPAVRARACKLLKAMSGRRMG